MDEKHFEFLKKKSIDSFLLSIEVFNKPTIDYRLEGCVFFLCNAWELMLKAKLLKDGKSIYYPKSSRTLSLSDCANKLMTNKKDPIRINLEIITALRNTATHDIIPELEIVYLPYLTFCVKAYADKLYSYLNVNITEHIKSDFLALFTNNRHVTNEQILSKYGENMNSIFEKKLSDINEIVSNNLNCDIAYSVNINLVRVNNKSKADFSFYASNNPNDKNVQYIDRYLDLNQTHGLTFHQITNEIDRKLKQEKICFIPLREPVKTEKNPDPNIFTTVCLDKLIKKWDIKNNSEFCQAIKNGETVIYKYSPKLVDYIIALILDDSEVVIKCNKKN